MRRTKAPALVALVSAAALGLAACSGGASPEPAATGSSAESTDAVDPGEASEPGATSQVEVFTWWATGFEQLGLNALVEVFNEQHPEVEFINGAVAGGAGSQAKDLLQTRLQTNDPPDTFQAHAGKELQDYIDAGQIQDVSALYDEFGLRDAFPASLLDLLTDDGKIYSVPVNIHRSNVIWTNPAVLAEAGLDPSTTYYATIDEFIEALEAVDAIGKIGISVGTTWTQVHLLENVLLAELGGDAYSGLWDGTGDWNAPEVTAALQSFETIMSFTNTDRDGIDNNEATNLVVNGDAAFNVMGDWNIAIWDEQGLEAPEAFLYAPSPGTDGYFNYLADSFTWPVGAPNPEGTKAWLQTAGSAEGQLAFNTLKGSIPARSDANPADFPAYQQTAMESWANDVIVPSVAHGAATTIAQLTAISNATSKYTAGGSDLATFQSELAAAMS